MPDYLFKITYADHFGDKRTKFFRNLHEAEVFALANRLPESRIKQIRIKKRSYEYY